MLFVQALTNRSNIPGLVDETQNPYAIVNASESAEALRRRLRIDGSYPDDVPIIKALTRAALIFGRRAPAEVQTLISNTPLTLSKKEPAYIQNGVLLYGNLDTLPAPGKGDLKQPTQVLIQRTTGGDEAFKAAVSSDTSSDILTISGSLVSTSDGEVVTLGPFDTPDAYLKIHMSSFSAGQTIQVAASYPYSFSKLAILLSEISEAAALCENSEIIGFAWEYASTKERLGAVAVSLALDSLNREVV